MDTEIIRRHRIRSGFQYGQRLFDTKYSALKTFMQEVPEEKLARPGVRAIQLWRVPFKDPVDGVVRDNSFKGKLTLWGGSSGDDNHYMIEHLRKVALPLDQDSCDKEDHEHDAVLEIEVCTQRDLLVTHRTVVSIKFKFQSEEQAAKNAVLEASGSFRIPGLPESHPLKRVVYDITAWIQSTIKNPETGGFCWGPDTIIRRIEMSPSGVSRRQDLDLEDVANSLVSSRKPNLTQEYFKQELLSALKNIKLKPQLLYVKGCTCNSHKECPFCRGPAPRYLRTDPTLRIDDGAGVAVPLFPTICADSQVSPLDTSLDVNRVPGPPPPEIADLRLRSERIISIIGARALRNVAIFRTRLHQAALEEQSLSEQRSHSATNDAFRTEYQARLRALDADIFFTDQSMQRSIPSKASFAAELDQLDKGPSTLNTYLRGGLRYVEGGLALASQLRRLLEASRDYIDKVDRRVAPETFEYLINCRANFVMQMKEIKACEMSIESKLSGAAAGRNRRLGQYLPGQGSVVWYPRSGEKFSSFAETVEMLLNIRERWESRIRLVPTPVFTDLFNDALGHDLHKLTALWQGLELHQTVAVVSEKRYTGELTRNFYTCVSECVARFDDIETIMSDNATPEWFFDSEPDNTEYEKLTLQPAPWLELKIRAVSHRDFDVFAALISIPAVAEVIRGFSLAELVSYVRQVALPVIFWPVNYDDPEAFNRINTVEANIICVRPVCVGEDDFVARLLPPPWMIKKLRQLHRRGELTLSVALRQSLDVDLTDGDDEDSDFSDLDDADEDFDGMFDDLDAMEGRMDVDDSVDGEPEDEEDAMDVDEGNTDGA